MEINVENVYCQVEHATTAEHALLSRELSVRVPNYQYTKSYAMGHWDGMKKFYHRGYGTFLTGFLPLVCDLWREEGYTLTITDARKHYRPNYDATDLRDYQAHELARVLGSTLTFHDICAEKGGLTHIPWMRGIVKHPTGSGKTFFAGGIIRSTDLPTLYLVEKLDLLHQTQEFLADFLHRNIGIIGDSHVNIKKCTVGTVQTLRSRLDALRDYLTRIRMLLIDECHHVSDATYHTISTLCKRAPYRLGFSGTPLSRNDIGDVYLVGHTGNIISELDREMLEARGFLSTPTVYVFPVDDTPLSASYPQAYKYLIVESAIRNGIIGDIVQVCAKQNKKVLVLVRHIKHGKSLNRLFKKLHIKNIFLQGKDDADKRRRILKQLGTKGRNVIIATSIFDEGVDAPDIDCVVMAGGGASKIKSIQRVGRGLRPKEGANTLTVIDFDDTSNRYLSAHAYERFTAYEQEGFTIQMGVTREKFTQEIGR